MYPGIASLTLSFFSLTVSFCEGKVAGELLTAGSLILLMAGFAGVGVVFMAFWAVEEDWSGRLDFALLGA